MPSSAHALTSRRICIILAALQTVVILSLLGGLTAVTVFFGVHACDILTTEDIVAAAQQVDVVPRIIHQTWRESTLPDRWAAISSECRAMHPDYEYRLWSDESARDFIKKEYPSYLALFDGYQYPIQRADALRYFVLHHYGGVYLDVDVGCRKPFDPLLKFDIVLPQTKPVGISNDIIFAAARHPLMESAIESLASFDHSWILKYPTVMISSGPMFLSAVYSAFSEPDDGVRVLPKSLYGKWSREEDREEAYFDHYFASSWHGNDAGIVFGLENYGLYALYAFLLAGVAYALRYVYLRRREQRRALIIESDEEKDPLLFVDSRPHSPEHWALPPPSPQPALLGSRRTSLVTSMPLSPALLPKSD